MQNIPSIARDAYGLSEILNSIIQAIQGGPYGNYGGPGFTGGEQVEDPDKADYTKPGIDPLDDLFRQHDIDYANCEYARRENEQQCKNCIKENEYNCNWAAAKLFARCQLEADRKLRDAISKLPPDTDYKDPRGKGFQDLAEDALKRKNRYLIRRQQSNKSAKRRSRLNRV